MSVERYFKENGKLAEIIPHYAPRQGQIDLANAIDDCIQDGQHLIAEAGTGIGKTFSYLIPSLADDKSVLVSTATKHLQEQLFFKDMPLVEKLFDKKFSVCLLKGRANYLCLLRYKNLLDSQQPLTKKQLKILKKIEDWQDKTLFGDLSEVVVFSEEDSYFQKKITSTVDNCLGSDCAYFNDCFVQKIREKAKKSQIVIVNHALLFADALLKQTGFAEILPSVDVVIVDEAHQLPQIASQAFSEQLTSRQIFDFIDDCKDDISDTLLTALDTLEEAIKTFIKHLPKEQAQMPLIGIKHSKPLHQALKDWLTAFKVVIDEVDNLAEENADFQAMATRLDGLATLIKAIFNHKQQDNKQDNMPASVGILKWQDNYFYAIRSPIHLQDQFRDVLLEYADSWIFTSATLTVDKSFEYFTEQLGLPNTISTLQVNSPFDYQNQSRMHILQGLPDPRNAQFTQQFAAACLPILQACQGRAFLLFTSFKALYEAADFFAENGDFNLFVQGDLPKSQLIDSFLKADNALLLGTISFWEGVDVQGEALSCVMIDKIPFISPEDPLIKEQIRYLENKGQNSFASFFIPKAATLLKQGAGRLIRSIHDKGVLVLGDRRLVDKSYGQQLLRSIPPMPQVNYNELMQFIEHELHPEPNHHTASKDN